MSKEKIIYAIDLLRFIAVIEVVMFHYAYRCKIVGETLLDAEAISNYFKI